MVLDFDRCYRALESRDARFDGWFFTGVTSTGIYCRPSCPAILPKRANVRFHPTAAAAQLAGFRACKRCRPDAVPGSPEWNVRADVAARAMRLIGDGLVEREGVAGLAQRLAYSERHLNRLLTTELGAGPLALARARRAQTARVLIETTALPFQDVAFGAGFASVRQFNDTVRAVFASTPSGLRHAAMNGSAPAPGTIALRLAVREPFDWHGLVAFLGMRAVPGVEEVADGAYRRVLRLPHGLGVAELAPGDGHVRCALRLADVRDLGSAVERCRRLLDLDADPVAVDQLLGADPLLAPSVRNAPGRRVPGAADGAELAVRAMLGQQVSVAGARTLAGRLVAACGEPLPRSDGRLTHAFPSAEAIAAEGSAALAMPAARRDAIVGLCRTLASGDLTLDPGSDRDEARRALLALRGVGPWTADYIAMRALGNPDAFPATDLGVRKALERLGASVERAECWRPWRAYAVMHLWASLGPA